MAANAHKAPTRNDPIYNVWVTFHHAGDQVIVRCAGCNEPLGSWPLNDERAEIAAVITSLRQAGHEIHKPANWSQVNIASIARYAGQLRSSWLVFWSWG